MTLLQFREVQDRSEAQVSTAVPSLPLRRSKRRPADLELDASGVSHAKMVGGQRGMGKSEAQPGWNRDPMGEAVPCR